MAEAGAAFGDLGTLLPYALGAIATGVVAPAAVFLGFGLAYLATGWLYALPVAVQPMKAVAAVILTEGLSAAEIAATGVTLGAILLALGATGAIGRVARVLPQSVVAGLQLGLGLSLGLLALRMIAGDWVWGLSALAALLATMRLPVLPAALLVVVGAALINVALGGGAEGAAIVAGGLVIPDLEAFGTSALVAVLPQLPLTLTNAVIVTAAVAKDLFPVRADRVTERRLALSSGAMNLVFAPFGALPMCHGAGGLVAHHRFGGRSALPLTVIGAACLAVAVAPGTVALAVLGAIPAPVLGALLLVTSAQLALSKRLFDARPSCQVVIALTGLVCIPFGPAVALAFGWPAELIRQRLFRSRAWRRESA